MSRLRMIAGASAGTDYPLGSTVTVIGRRSTNQIVIDTEKASRSHSQVALVDGHFVLTDLGSVNGTYVNGTKITGATVLASGDDITIGGYTLRFFDDVDQVNTLFVPGYTIRELIAQGGMGKVYRALQNSMEREVALKVLHNHCAERTEFVQRFVQEARSAGKLSHPNIILVHDVGKAGSTYYFSMELVLGNDLSQLMGLRTLSFQEVFSTCSKVADALDYAHRNGIVHRDIKPDNIILAENNVVKLADLGIAKIFDVDTGQGSDLTREGKVLGTPHYMSPEQASGGHIDGRSDIYSLGATLFHLLAGEPPFDGATNQEIMVKHLNEEPRDLATLCPTLPRQACDVITKMMSKDREVRYATAREVSQVLMEISTLKPRPAPLGIVKPKVAPAGKVSTLTPSTGRSNPMRIQKSAGPSLWAKIGVFVSVLLIALVVISLFRGNKVDSVEETAGPDARQLIERALRREMASPPDYEGALLIYGQVIRDFPGLPDIQKQAKARISAIEAERSKVVEVVKWKEALDTYVAWEKSNMEQEEERVTRLDSLAKQFPDQAERFRSMINEIAKAKESTAKAEIKKDYAECRKAVSTFLVSGNFDGAQEAITRFGGKYPDAAETAELKPLSDQIKAQAKERFDTFQKAVDLYLNEEKTDFGLALKVFRNYQETVISSEYASRVASRFKKFEVALADFEVNLTNQVKADILEGKFDNAVRALESAVFSCKGTDFELTFSKRIQAVQKLRQLRVSLISAISSAGGKIREVRVDAYGEGKIPMPITGVTEEGLKVPMAGSGGNAITLLPWNALSPEDMLKVYQLWLPAEQTVVFAKVFDLEK